MVKRLFVSVAAALGAVTLTAAAAPATFEGVHAGANYKIVVPASEQAYLASLGFNAAPCWQR